MGVRPNATLWAERILPSRALRRLTDVAASLGAACLRDGKMRFRADPLGCEICGLKQLGIEHIAAYSPEARGRSERMFGTSKTGWSMS